MKKTLIALMLFASIPIHAQAQIDRRSYDQMVRDHQAEQAQISFEIVKLEAEMGDPDYQYLLGTCYLEGVVVPQDINEAKKWFMAAARNGDELAKAMIIEIFFCEKQGIIRNGKFVR